ncbi:PH domain-containing protein [Oerskovia sp. NPDC057915]|uniref:PH domain-containing protein n=1 Tax=Oerskovia sp. NPDC057915 TaxID=3346280 RepID=UPI0036D96AC7
MAQDLPAPAHESAPRLSARHLRRYILPGERVVLATRAHWGKLAEPVATTFAAFVLAAWLVSVLAPAVGEGSLLLWWAWVLVALRLLWKVLDWRNEWFVATDKRMLLMFGLVTHKVAMMPLGKVTDMSYSRSILGRILGYGQFILESAGQDQAMSRINWVANPDATYRKLCDTIFIPGGRGGPWGQHPQGGTPGGGAAPPPTAHPGPAPLATPQQAPTPVPGRLSWAPTSDGPEGDLSAAATQPIAVRSVQAGGQGHLFVAPRGSSPRLAGTDRPVMAPPPPPPAADRPVSRDDRPDTPADLLDDGTSGEADGPAWEVSDDDRGRFVPVTPWDPQSGWQATDPWSRPDDSSGPTATTGPPVPPPPG